MKIIDLYFYSRIHTFQNLYTLAYIHLLGKLILESHSSHCSIGVCINLSFQDQDGDYLENKYHIHFRTAWFGVRNITAIRLAQALQRIKLCNTVVVDWDFVYLWCCGDNINQGCPKISNSFFILEGLKILPSVRRCIGI